MGTVCSLSDYQEFISTLVERYGGDGSGDMPGLTRGIKRWEISNEPEACSYLHSWSGETWTTPLR